MRKNIILILIVIISISCNNEQLKNEKETFPVLTGKYLGQEEPKLQPKIFAPDIISTGKYELNAVFSPDYTEFYFSIRVLSGQIVIMYMKNINNQWTEPEVVSFSGKYSDADPFITYDGNWLYFVSMRPVDSSQEAKHDYDIWRVNRHEDEWGEPERLDSTINSEYSDVYPTLTKDGTLYFSSGRDNASGGRDIFRSEWNDNEFQQAEKLDGVINDFREGDVFISPDEDYLIYSSRGREEGSGLFISFRENNKWNAPQFIGETINLTGGEYCPMVTPDGKYLFYTSEKDTFKPYSDTKMTLNDILNHYNKFLLMPQNGLGDIYWIDAKIIKEFRFKSR
ncbi:MAG: PD40 domain-containing protein [Bacteroidales bacterium]|nr:PD40 domain-containing protein [Bacteroidales bacterium]